MIYFAEKPNLKRSHLGFLVETLILAGTKLATVWTTLVVVDARENKATSIAQTISVSSAYFHIDAVQVSQEFSIEEIEREFEGDA